MFWAVRGILKDNPSLKEGGALWFRDLTQADPYFVLKLATICTLLLVLVISIALAIPAPLRAVFFEFP